MNASQALFVTLNAYLKKNKTKKKKQKKTPQTCSENIYLKEFVILSCEHFNFLKIWKKKRLSILLLINIGAAL